MTCLCRKARKSQQKRTQRFSDFYFNIALKVEVTDYDGNESSVIPEQYARIAAKLRNQDSLASCSKADLKPCNEPLAQKYVNEQNSELVDKLFCLDSFVAQTFGFRDYVDAG